MPRSAKPQAAPAPVATPGSVLRVAAVGIPVALAASGAVSFQGLTLLGSLAGIAHPWLMPLAIDVYAATATLITMLLPEGHRAYRSAMWNARLGLAMSMTGNAVARALHLGAGGYTPGDAILTFIGSWPSWIVERLLHLQGKLTVAPATATPCAAAAGNASNATPSAQQGVARESDGNAVAVAPPRDAQPPQRPAATRNPAQSARNGNTGGTRATNAPGNNGRVVPLRNTTERAARRAATDEIVAALLAAHGDDYNLGKIAEALGTPHRATAMRARDRVIKARSAPQNAAQPADANSGDTEENEPERAGTAA